MDFCVNWIHLLPFQPNDYSTPFYFLRIVPYEHFLSHCVVVHHLLNVEIVRQPPCHFLQSRLRCAHVLNSSLSGDSRTGLLTPNLFCFFCTHSILSRFQQIPTTFPQLTPKSYVHFSLFTYHHHDGQETTRSGCLCGCRRFCL